MEAIEKSVYSKYSFFHTKIYANHSPLELKRFYSKCKRLRGVYEIETDFQRRLKAEKNRDMQIKKKKIMDKLKSRFTSK